MAIRVVDASRLYDESDSEAHLAHQTSLILSDARWLRIAGAKIAYVFDFGDDWRVRLETPTFASASGWVVWGRPSSLRVR
jgi:hypothetical protein